MRTLAPSAEAIAGRDPSPVLRAVAAGCGAGRIAWLSAGFLRCLTRARHRTPAIERHFLEQPASHRALNAGLALTPKCDSCIAHRADLHRNTSTYSPSSYGGG